jgi:UDPglucose 6-dehydrogenase
MPANKPTVTIIGCGYVGVTTAVILANCGYKVYALEPLKDRLESLQAGKSFFFEEGVEELLQAGLKSGNLIVTDSYEEAVSGSDVVFCCMGTPDNPDGSSNLAYVFGAVEGAVPYLNSSAVFVQKSTVPVGTGDRIRDMFSAAGVEAGYVSNPEFLREGTAIFDTLWTDRIVVGSENKVAAEKVADLYRSIEAAHNELGKLAGITAPQSVVQTQYITMGQNAAELVKVSANAYLALKISFANSIAKLADKAHADITEVMAAVGADKRIGKAFFNAGRGYGGGCFPKDVSGLIRSAQDYGVELGIMQAVSELNASMPHYIIHKVENLLDKSQPLDNANVAVLGLAFKAGTSDTRRSPAIAITNTLVDHGAKVTAYDPQAMHEAKPDLLGGVKLADSLDDALKDAEILFVTTDWPDFVNLDLQKLKQKSRVSVIVDCMNCLNQETVQQQGFTYIGVGKGN